MVPPTYSVVEQLDKKLLADEKASQEEQGYYPLRPSSAGKCSRRLAHELAAYTGQGKAKHEQRKPSILRLLGFGHSVEWHVLRLLERVPGLKVKHKQQVVGLFNLPSGRLVEGSIDCTLEHGTWKAVADVKSVGDRYSSWNSSKWDDILYKLRNMKTVGEFAQDSFYILDIEEFFDELGEDSLRDNIMQVNSYCLSDFAKARGFDENGLIVRYNKNNSRMMEIHFKANEKVFNHLHDRYGLIEAAVKVGRIGDVPRDFVLGSMACTYCPYITNCYPNVTNKERFQGFPAKQWASRIGELSNADKLRELFGPYLHATAIGESAKNLEKQILLEMQHSDVVKLKIDDGTVWEAKTLQSPKPHQELRRGKE